MIRVIQEVRAAYDQIVRTYAEQNDGAVPAALIPHGEQLVKHAGKAARVIDVGCGTGRDMAWLESQGVAVTGIDLSCEMLRYARAKVRGDLFAMEMSRLGFRDGCFDAAWCCASLLHLPKIEARRALTEIRRVLKAGSLLMLSLQKGSGEGWEGGYGDEVRRFFARYGVEELQSLLPSTGFAVRDMQAYPGQGSVWLVSTCVAQ